MRISHIEPYALTVVSGWEFCALLTGRIPTFTSLVRPLPWLARAGIVLAASAFFARHFRVV